MKSKELIKILQELDPTGEIEVVVGCEDIYFGEKAPMYYDGIPAILIRDESKAPNYDIVGFKMTSSGYKIIIHTVSIEDIISEDPNCIVDLDEYAEKHYGKLIDFLKNKEEK